jgi:hypothetical protein
MSAARYLWRQLNQKQREELLAWRKVTSLPVAFTAASAQLWTSAISHFRGLLRTPSSHRLQPGTNGQFLV